VKEKHYLQLGDVVTFGHLGGHAVSPGQMAPKQPAEFQFVVGISQLRFQKFKNSFKVQHIISNLYGFSRTIYAFHVCYYVYILVFYYI